MIEKLIVSNYVLFDYLEIDFSKNLNIITGETGAGKSLLIDAINFISGAKNSKDLHRDKNQNVSVIAIFYINDHKKKVVSDSLQEIGVSFTDQIILRRELKPNLRSQAWVNEVPVTNNSLKEIFESIVQLQAQHSQYSSFTKKKCLELLDQYSAINDHEIKTLYQNLKEQKQIYNDLLARQSNTDREIEFLKYNIEELSKLEPVQGEETELIERKKTLSNHAKINELTNNLTNLLGRDNGAVNNLYKAQKVIISGSNFLEESKIQSINDLLEKSYFDIEEAINIIDSLRIDNVSDREMDELENRLFSLREMARKFRCNVDELENKLSSFRNELETLEQIQHKLDGQLDLINEAKQNFLNVANKLSEIRKTHSLKLEQEIYEELKSLDLPKARFKVKIKELDENNWHEKGLEEIIFEVATNPGMGFSSINETASGGEMSRIFLALELVMGKYNSPLTIIFDEVDTGVSGKTATHIGNRLKKLAESVQVMVVTHQPQVAAFGDKHLKLFKNQDLNVTSSNIKELKAGEKVYELARMLSGQDITEKTLAAANELYDQANQTN